MQNFINAVINTTTDTLGSGCVGFIDPGMINCAKNALYISSDGTSGGSEVLDRSFRGAGKFASQIINAAISVGDIKTALDGGVPAASTVGLSSFGLEGYLDLWSPQAGTIMDRVGVKNPDVSFDRPYSSIAELNASLCNIYQALQFLMLGCFFQASASQATAGTSQATNAVRFSHGSNFAWIGGGCSPISRAPDGGLIGFAVDSLGLGDSPQAAKITLQDLHFEGLRYESILLKAAGDVSISCHFRPHATHDTTRAVVQLGDPASSAKPAANVTVQNCYAVSDGGGDTFLQASYVAGLKIAGNSVKGFATGFAIGSQATGVDIDPYTDVSDPTAADASQSLAMLTPGGVVSAGNIDQTVFTVTTLTSGTIAAGQPLFGPGVAPGTVITGGSGSSWTVSPSQRVSGTAFSSAVTTATSTGSSISGKTLTIGSGTGFAMGQFIYGVGVTPGTQITGGPGPTTWTVNLSQTVASTAISGVTPAAMAQGFMTGSFLELESLTSGTLAVGQLVVEGGVGVGAVSGDTAITALGANPDGTGAALVSTHIPAGTKTYASLAPAAVVTGSISDGTLIVNETLCGALAVGQVLLGPGVWPGTLLTTLSHRKWTLSAEQGSQSTGPSVFTAYAVAASFTGSTSGTNLTVSSGGAGIAIGQALIGPGIETGTVITGFSSPNWTISTTQTAASNPMLTIATAAVFSGAISSGAVTISSLPSLGAVAWGQYLIGPAIPPGTWVTSLGAGTYGSGSTVVVGQTLPIMAFPLLAPTNFTASIAGTTMTLAASTALSAGQAVLGTGVAVGTAITSGSGTSYSVGISQTLPSSSLTTAPSAAVLSGSIAGTILTVGSVSSGTLAIGQSVTGMGVAAGTTISNVGSGTGGPGTYDVNSSQSVPTTVMVATSGPIGAVVTGAVTNNLLTVWAVQSGSVAIGDNLPGLDLVPSNYVSASGAGPSGVTAYNLKIPPASSYSINPGSLRSYFDNVADAPLNLGIQTTSTFTVEFTSSRDFTLSLSMTGHTLNISTTNLQTSAEYTLVITSPNSAYSIAHWGAAGAPIVFSGTQPTFSGMSPSQYGVVKMKVVGVGSTPVLTLF
ncbi:MAG TPA: hypothetical protein VG166_07770, partial [Caulobacteraceae bacterium]|nr:hypothetical protein [Caulobacteraceae bacterium]